MLNDHKKLFKTSVAKGAWHLSVPLSILSLICGGLILSNPSFASTTKGEYDYYGPEKFRKCQKLLNENAPSWRELVQDRGNDDIWSSSWEQLYSEIGEAINIQGGSGTGSFNQAMKSAEVDLNYKMDEIRKLQRDFNSALEKIESHFNLLIQCEAAIAATKNSPFEKSSNENSPSGGYAKQSSDGQLVCQSNGVYTQDYMDCAEIIDKYEMAKVGEYGMNTVQKVDMQDHMIDQQNQLSNDSNAAGTSALKAQKSAVNKSAQQATQKSVFHATKAAVLWDSLSNMPTTDDIFNMCNESGNGEVYRKLVNEDYIGALDKLREKARKLNSTTITYTNREGEEESKEVNLFNEDATEPNNLSRDFDTGQSILNWPDDGQPSPTQINLAIHPYFSNGETRYSKNGEQAKEQACTEVVYQDSFSGIALNQPMRDKVKSLLVKAGVDMTAETMKADMYKKQANQIGKSIDKVENFEPDAPQVEYEEAKAKACEVNPMHPSCMDDEGRQQTDYQGDSFEFGGTGTGTVAQGAQVDDDRDSGGGGGSPGSDSRVPNDLGSPISEVDKSKGFESTPPAPGSIKRKGGGGGGGSGGGGAGGVGAPSNGGARGGGGGGNNKARVPDVDKAGYGGGGGGSLAYGGGGGIGRTNNDRGRGGDDNPFKKLLGKKNGKNNGNMRFGRGPASQVGKKNGSLFEMISHRYKKVSDKDRLLEYEIKKNSVKGDVAN